jgi:cell division protein FtsZ
MQEIFEIADGLKNGAVIRVIGVGGGGSNTVEHMTKGGVEGVELFCANTDRKHLEGCVTPNQIQLGTLLTRGLGAGSRAEVGRMAADEDRERIAEMLKGTDLLFITAGMGGGTGTGAAPVIAEIAREMKILTVAVVTKPFQGEGGKRMEQANAGISKLAETVDSLIVIPNDKLRLVLGGKVSLKEAFAKADDVLKNAVMGISDLITRPGLISVDFADVQTVMGARGMAMMGVGVGSGENRAEVAASAALASPLLDDIEIRNAQGLLINITCDETLSLDEQGYILDHITAIAGPNAEIKCGTALDPNLNGELRVTVVATGLCGGKAQHDVLHTPLHLPQVQRHGRPGAPLSGVPSHRPQPVQQLPQVPTLASHQQHGMGTQMAGGGGFVIPLPSSPYLNPGAAGVRSEASKAPRSWLDEIDEEQLNIPSYVRRQAD